MRKLDRLMVLALVAAGIALTAGAAEIAAESAKAIREAFQKAQPGDVIAIKPGVYDMGNSLATGGNGTKQRPIVVRATGAKGYAHLKANGTVAFRINSHFWTFQGIHFEGSPQSTSAALFMDGPSGCGDIAIAECKISGSREHGMKGAKLRERPVDRVLIERTELFNTGSTGFDLPSGDDWILRNNYVHDYGRNGGVSYGIFLKGGGKNAIVEGNFVDGSGGTGATIGISFGGGLMGQQWLPLLPDGSFAAEHENGIARNNIVVKSRDVAYHSNNATKCKFYNNLAWGCSDFQRQQSYPPDPVLVNNLIGGKIRNASASRHTLAPRAEWFVDAAAGDFRLSDAGRAALVGKGETLPDNPADFFGTRRTQPAVGPVLPGARLSTAWRDPR